jgi:hypothetical protein
MLSPTFEFFEVIAEELCSDPLRVITSADLQINEDQAFLFDELKTETRTATTEQAMQAAVVLLDAHFKGKGSKLPFTYDPETGLFEAIDLPYLIFIKEMSNIRSIGKRSREFELGVLDKLKSRVTGSLHRVGHPRDRMPRQPEFNAYLKTLGFKGNVLLGQEKDGGLDILWILPIGTKPHRPIVSVQCKNGAYDIGAADVSIGAGSRSLALHGGLQATVHVPCVLFNDYLYPEVVTDKPMNFVPLGLTDLSPMVNLLSSEAI